MSGTQPQTGAAQWIRQLSLVAGDKKGAIELSGLHCTFRISAMTTTSPSVLLARIYNVSPQTAKYLSSLPMVIPGQGADISSNTQTAKVVVQAGYSGNFATVFNGQLIQVKLGRDTPADTWVDLVAGDGSDATALAIINATLSSGHQAKDVNSTIGNAYSQYGVSAGEVPETGGADTFSTRQGYVWLRTRSSNTVGTVKQHDQLHTARTGEVLETIISVPAGQAVVVTSRTGMIGLPTQTDFGVVVRVLLNPAIGAGTLIQINNASIQRQTFATDLGATDANTFLDALDKYADSSADGVYYVFATETIGDTRGTEWYTDCLCVASDITTGGLQLPTVPAQYISGRNRIIPGNQ